MTHVDILAKFLEMFPQFHSAIKAYAPAGYNTILIEFRNNFSYPCKFAYHSDQNWSFTREQGEKNWRYRV